MKNTLSIFLGIMAMLALGCNKGGDKTTCSAGSGGSVTIVAFPKHHGKAVRPYMAYVKYNSKDAPSSTANYDLTKQADTTEDHIELTGLKCGDYYIYVTAYDTAVKADVKGGIPYTLGENATGEVTIDVPVTE